MTDPIRDALDWLNQRLLPTLFGEGVDAAFLQSWASHARAALAAQPPVGNDDDRAALQGLLDRVHLAATDPAAWLGLKQGDGQSPADAPPPAPEGDPIRAVLEQLIDAALAAQPPAPYVRPLAIEAGDAQQDYRSWLTYFELGENCGGGAKLSQENCRSLAALLRSLSPTLLRQPAPAVVPVPVAERPWKREGWCDAEGRCWWSHGPTPTARWSLLPMDGMDDARGWLLPHWAIPPPPAAPGGGRCSHDHTTNPGRSRQTSSPSGTP